MARMSLNDIDATLARDDGFFRPLRHKHAGKSPTAPPQHEPGNRAFLSWARSVPAAAERQLERLAALPIVGGRGIAVMPDVHPGHGACVGTVIPTRGALVPSAVGLDAGCGMVAVALDLHGRQLPDSLRRVRAAIEKAVPLGTGGIHREVAAPDVWAPLALRYEAIAGRDRRLLKRGAGEQLGTLGSGNHFIEVCLDETARVWVMIHSGSRGAGALIGHHHIAAAKRRCKAEGIALPDRNLAWLPEGTPEFEAYVEALLWAQDYARDNRRVMLDATLQALSGALGKPVRVLGEAVQCHHNYVARERHHGEDLWLTRKGAIRAGLGEWGIVPGSMGTASFIVRGKGNPLSYCSCAHGAGRTMSRGEARARFTAADLQRQTAGVECRKDRAVVDEIPLAYKDIHDVMAEQADLVEVLHTLRQVVCVKGT